MFLRKAAFDVNRAFFATVNRAAMSTSNAPTFFDIGVNLTDDMYAGRYHGKKVHDSDLDEVMGRAQRAGVVGQMVTVGQLDEVQPALELTKRYGSLYCTAGVHPTRTSQVGEGDEYIDSLKAILVQHAISPANPSGRIISMGEIGLDYDRLHFSSKAHQTRHFKVQLDLAKQYQLPLFLHSRSAHTDFVSILGPHLKDIAASDTGRTRSGVVHCFTGTLEEMKDYLELGLFIGLTGCSFKTQEGIQVAQQVPLDRLLLETDAPWCDIRATHASAPLWSSFSKSRPDLAQMYQPASVKKEKWEKEKMVKSRCEPCGIGCIAAIVAESKGIQVEEVASAALENTRFLFGI
jgi:TatD DNase family protein